MYYGLTKESDLRSIALAICECLGHGANNTAFNLLVETAGAETHRGSIKDTSIGAGMGLTQFDQMPFNDTKDRASERDKQKILDYFDINIDFIEWEHLRYNPLLAMIFARLKYKKLPATIPNTLRERAEYWKQHYNTYLGKGTVEHYIKSNHAYEQEDGVFFHDNKA